MNETIKNFIFEQSFNYYNQDFYSKADLQSFVEYLNEEIDIALDCYNRLDEEERYYEVVERAWDMYLTVREYNQPVINALKTILRMRGER